MHPGFTEIIRQVPGTCGLAPDALELEITESLLMEDPEAAIQILNKLRRFLIDRLKIDSVFVPENTTNTNDAVIAMADTMDMRVIAEGARTMTR